MTGDPDVDAVFGGTPAPPQSGSNSTWIKTGDPDVDAVIGNLDAPSGEKQPTYGDFLTRGPSAAGAKTPSETWDDIKSAGKTALGGATEFVNKNVLGLMRGGMETLAPHAMAAHPDVWRDIEQSIGYYPTSPETKAGAGAVDAVLGFPNKAGAAVTQKTGIPELGGAVETAIGNFPLAKGVRAAPMRAAAAAEPAIAAVEAPKPEAAFPASPAMPEPEAAAAGGHELPPEQQAERAKTLARLGLPPEQVRRSAITGDTAETSNDYQMANYKNTPHGKSMGEQLATERAALSGNVDDMIDKTGATHIVDQTDADAAGKRIMAPLEQLRDWFKDQTDKLYSGIRAKVGDTPVQTPSFHEIARDESNFANTEAIALERGLKARMTRLGMLDENGAPKPTTIGQAEQLRQYLNEQWQPKTSGVIRKLKDALTDDVTAAGGQDFFAPARKLRELRGRTLDDPKGISSLMDSDGVNRKVAYEDVPRFVTGLDKDQFGKIIDALDNVPAEVKPAADTARAEIKGAFLNRASAIGNGNKAVGSAWRAPQFESYLRDNSANLSRVFEPAEMARLNDIRNGGNYLNLDRRYTGAHAQQVNTDMLSRVTEGAANVAAGGTAAAGHPIVALGLKKAGEMAGERLSARASAKRFQSRLMDPDEFVSLTEK